MIPLQRMGIYRQVVPVFSLRSGYDWPQILPTSPLLQGRDDSVDPLLTFSRAGWTDILLLTTVVKHPG